MKCFRYIILIICFVGTANANELDSLLSVVDRLSGKEKVLTLQKIGSIYFNRNPMEAHKYYHLALSYAREIDEQALMAYSFTNIAAINFSFNNNKAALDTFLISIDIFEKTDEKKGAVFAYSQIGAIFSNLGKYDTALVYFSKSLSYYSFKSLLDSLELFKKMPDPLPLDQSRFIHVHAIAYNDYALCQYNLGYYDEAIRFFKMSLQLGEGVKRKDRIGAALNNLGMVYFEKKELDKAEDYYLRSIEIFREIEHYRYLAISLSALAEVYLKSNKLKLAKNSALESLLFFEKIGVDPVNALIILGDIETKAKSFNQAEYYYNEALKAAYRSELHISKLNVLRSFANMYAQKGDYKNAYSKLKTLQDILHEQEKNINTDKLNELLAFYELDQKSKEIELMEKNAELSNAELKRKEMLNAIYFIALLFLVASIIGLLLIFRIRAKSSKIISNKNAELEELNLYLQESNDTKDRFFSIIAHDIKNPIASTKQVTELLIDDAVELTEEEKREFLESLFKSSVHLMALLDNLLTWARSQTGKIKCSPDYIDLDSLVDGELGVLLNQYSNKNIKVKFDKSNFKLFADSNMLSTVIRNLLTNAIKYTPNGGSIHIKSEPDVKPNFVKIYVSDSGIGMSEEVKERLFQLGKHRSERGTNDEEGTGLGLIVSKEFVERHGGEIEAISELDKGSTFTFTMPVYTGNMPEYED